MRKEIFFFLFVFLFFFIYLCPEINIEFVTKTIYYD